MSKPTVSSLNAALAAKQEELVQLLHEREALKGLLNEMRKEVAALKAATEKKQETPEGAFDLEEAFSRLQVGPPFRAALKSFSVETGGTGLQMDKKFYREHRAPCQNLLGDIGKAARKAGRKTQFRRNPQGEVFLWVS
jgi:hypothetical protein